MEMQQIRYFLALAETLNFTRAAERCNVTQPALTRAIQSLEAEFGGPLFHRERQNTHLSELGRMLMPYFEGILRQAATAQNAAKAFGRLDRGQLRIGAMCTIGPAIISRFLAKFCLAHPEIELAVVDANARRLIDMLAQGDLEIAILAIPDPLDMRFHGIALFEERFVAVVPPDHRLANLDVVPCRELAGEAYCNRANCEYFDAVSEEFAERGISMRQVFTSERDEWVIAMIKAGLGVGYFPEFSATDPDVVTRPLIEPAFQRMVTIVTVRGRPHSPAVGAFIRHARNERWPGPDPRRGGAAEK
jgi:DNA-binding transcriptional LysR family regulator